MSFFHAIINQGLVVSAGGDQTINSGDTVQLAGSGTGTWSTSGTGTFDNASLKSAIYTPSAFDITVGEIRLKYSNGNASDAMQLNILQTEAVTLFSKLPGLSDAQKLAVSRFIRKSKNRGHYTQLDQLVLCGGLGSEANSLVDWIGSNDLTKHGTTVPTWTNASGFTTNGTDGYLSSNFIPSSELVVGSLNDHFFFVVIKGKTTTAGSSGTLYGAVGTNVNHQISIGQSATGVLMKDASSNTKTNTYFNEVKANSYYSSVRSSSSTISSEFNGQLLESYTETSVAMPDRAIYVGCRNNNGTADSFFGADIVAWGVGKRSTVNRSLFFVDLETLLMELGVWPESSTYGIANLGSGSNDALVLVGAGQSLYAGSNSTPPADLVDPLDARVAFRTSFVNPLTLQQLDFGVNGNYESVGGYAQELRMGKEIGFYHPSQKFCQIKYAISGSSMYPNAGSGNDWSVGSNELLFDFKERFVLPGLDLLDAEGKNIRIVAYDWYQGQADAGGNGGADPQYRENFTAKLKNFIDALEADGRDLSEMWVIVHRILDRYVPARDFADEVRADQDELPTYFFAQHPTYVTKIAGIVVSNSDDLINNSDTVHESADAVEVRAARTARFVLSKISLN